jgi:P27 family predicted phage terminase small subunit
MRVLTAADVEAFAAFCQTYVRWRQAEDFVTKHGMVYPLRDERGQVRCMVQFPQVSIARNLLLVLRSFYPEFGMTPAARSRIELPFSVELADDQPVLRDRHGRALG